MNDFPDHLIGTVLQESYPFTCPACKKEHEAAPSISMRTGMNHGVCRCPRTGRLIRLEIADAGDRMDATEPDLVEFPWDD